MDWLLTPQEIDEALRNARPGGVIYCHPSRLGAVTEVVRYQSDPIHQWLIEQGERLLARIMNDWAAEVGVDVVPENRVCISCGSATQPCCGH